jgi:hypothetical protein
MEWLIGISGLIGAGLCILLGAVGIAYLWEKSEGVDGVGRVIYVALLLFLAVGMYTRADAKTALIIACVWIGLAICIAICSACIRYLWEVSGRLWSTKPRRTVGVIVVALLSTAGLATVAAAYAKLYDDVYGMHIGGNISSPATEAVKALQEPSHSSPQGPRCADHPSKLSCE